MKIHLIGIGGTGMGALAGLLREAGHEVRGSDGPLYPPMSTLLADLGVPVFEGFGAENLDWGPDRVVVGNICRPDHLEASAARDRQLPVTSFPALLSELFLSSRHVIVVAGTHGKTTTSSMVVHLLRSCGLDPGFLVGGIPCDLGRSFGLGSPPYFVVEGDEYDCAFFDKRPKFVHYRPQTVILTGVEYDHADIYPSLEAVEDAFRLLLAQVPPEGRVLVCADSGVAMKLCESARCPVETYSAALGASWRGSVHPLPGGRQRIAIRRDGEVQTDIDLGMTGVHNAQNAVAVVAMARALGLAADRAAEGLGSFAGVRRRQEIRGVVEGVTVIDDFAHHPTAVQTTLRGLRGVFGSGRLLAAFEPRSATSRRRIFQKLYAEALVEADHVVVAPLHAPAGIPDHERLDVAQLVRDLADSGTEASCLDQVEPIARHLADACRPGDTIVVMSSGGFGGLVDRLLIHLRERARAASPGRGENAEQDRERAR